MKIALVLLHLLFKAAPLFRSLDIANLFLPFKVAAVYALTLRDAARPVGAAELRLRCRDPDDRGRADRIDAVAEVAPHRQAPGRNNANGSSIVRLQIAPYFS